MRIEKGLYSIWLNFSLNLTSDLDFQPGHIYHLRGNNGSGKSSFVTQILLPSLLELNIRYVVYFEQQMHLQIQMAKAYSSVIKPRIGIKSEQETVDFLLQSLLTKFKEEPRPCYVIIDESPYDSKIRNFLDTNIPDCCQIYTSHSEPIHKSESVLFEPLSTRLSRVHAIQN